MKFKSMQIVTCTLLASVMSVGSMASAIVSTDPYYQAQGFFLTTFSSAVFLSNGRTSYCTVQSMDDYLNYGGNRSWAGIPTRKNFPQNMVHAAACPSPVEAPGYFVPAANGPAPVKLGVYYSNGNHDYCWVNLGGKLAKIPPAQIVRRDSAPTNMTYDGPCN